MQEKQLKLTRDEIILLRVYIQLTSKYSKKEQQACEVLSTELKEDGTFRYPDMKNEAKDWKSLNEEIEKILKKL